ncbi:phosphatase PAP2 family protein [Inhella proteolytica]|uniref:Phosphatase PAP2 family protein n=1 Tax=Inhella proteolytica TaxID=2795029 RepID=A0A931IZS9_9BURK|nr:phosphatase PAP2 family protein [Inhella proteolytica]MBH9576831.1 phosphatase PAP2 family protein [Inhella proteolytica]
MLAPNCRLPSTPACPTPPDYGPLITLAPEPPNDISIALIESNQAADLAVLCEARGSLFEAIKNSTSDRETRPHHPKIAGASALAPVDSPAKVFDWDRVPQLAVLQFELISQLEIAAQSGCDLELGVRGKPALLRLTRPNEAKLSAMAKAVAGRASSGGCETEIAAQAKGSLLLHLAPLADLSLDEESPLLACLRLAEALVMPVLQRLKHGLAVPRPHEVESMPTVVRVPGHGAMPAGHACMGFLHANLVIGLGALAGRSGVRNQKLLRAAARIADNRVRAGLHYPADNVAGALLGTVMAQVLLSGLSSAPPITSYTFDANQSSSSGEFSQADFGESQGLPAALQPWSAAFTEAQRSPADAPALPIWTRLLREAVLEEWKLKL